MRNLVKLCTFLVFSRCTAQDNESPPPMLSGQHFRITVVHQEGFVERKEDGEFGGYSISIVKRLAEKANFTYEFSTPSGRGKWCSHPEDGERGDYDDHYSMQYMCGQSDVNDLYGTEYATDMYVSLYYITPERLLENQFTISFHPPTTGSLTMFGTATNIINFENLLERQIQGLQGPICVQANTAQEKYLRENFPTMLLKPTPTSSEGFYQAMQDQICDIMIAEYPAATRFVLLRSQQNQCQVNGKPIGVIGQPLSFGFNQMAIGVRRDMPKSTMTALNFWLSVSMSCAPTDEDVGLCKGDEPSFSEIYPFIGGKGGTECDYVPFPVSSKRQSPAAIAGIVLSAAAVLVVVMVAVFYYRSLQQQKRYKKRFVQQIARNLNIGPSPGSIPANQLADEIEHIGGKKGMISKADLAKWMFDVKLTFLSQKDFDALWNAMDIDRTGEIDAIEFITFLSCCGDQFEEVYAEQQKLSKVERLKFAARRLENIHEVGEEGVRKIENSMERKARQGVHINKPVSDASSGSARIGWKKQIHEVSNAFQEASESC